MGTVFSSKKGIFLTNATIHKMGSAAFHAPKSTKKDTPDGVSFGEMVGLQGLEPGTVRL